MLQHGTTLHIPDFPHGPEASHALSLVHSRRHSALLVVVSIVTPQMPRRSRDFCVHEACTTAMILRVTRIDPTLKEGSFGRGMPGRVPMNIGCPSPQYGKIGFPGHRVLDDVFPVKSIGWISQPRSAG
jgi:hypothetical protein